MKRIRGWSAVAAVVVFTLCLVTPASSQTARGPATRFTPTHPIDYPDTPPVDYTGEPDPGAGGIVGPIESWLIGAMRRMGLATSPRMAPIVRRGQSTTAASRREAIRK